MRATEYQMELLVHIRRYGPITAECIVYDLDDHRGVDVVQQALVIMRGLKWLDGNKTDGYVISERFQWLRDIE